jgi:hypothetical protein
MSDELKAAKRLLKAIDGIYCGAEVQPGKAIQTKDVIRVCESLIALHPLALEAQRHLPGINCDDFHHAPGDYHQTSEPCPVEARLRKGNDILDSSEF